ncbi:MAG: WGR domain-containing protein [Methylococcaceae bacterium]|nr:WGR domain-containing protein [Methylococcaceae bacterium]
MSRVYLEYHDDSQNKHRFYQLWVLPSLFEDWALVKEWGRVGSPGTVRKEWFATQEAAFQARENLAVKKIKKGYFIKT